jgi:hypothetical protein
VREMSDSHSQRRRSPSRRYQEVRMLLLVTSKQWC